MTTKTNEDRDAIVNEELSDQELDGVVGGGIIDSLRDLVPDGVADAARLVGDAADGAADAVGDVVDAIDDVSKTQIISDETRNQIITNFNNRH